MLSGDCSKFCSLLSEARSDPSSLKPSMVGEERKGSADRTDWRDEVRAIE